MQDILADTPKDGKHFGLFSFPSLLLTPHYPSFPSFHKYLSDECSMSDTGLVARGTDKMHSKMAAITTCF